MSTDPRLADVLEALQDIASGNLDRRVEISAAHDELDAIGHALNVVGGELDFATTQLTKARDEANQANEAKTVFVRNISHEFRTPLSAILGFAQLLQTADFDSATRQHFCARIVANVKSLAELLDDILDLSQVESGKMAMEMRPTSVGQLLGEVVTNLEPTAHKKGIALLLETSVDDPGGLLVLVDPRRLRQILVNVIGNAVKFTTHGRVVVRAEREGRDVVIDVGDTGIGIEPGHVDRLFQPFSQADPSIGRRFGGTGLGLALARRMAREMTGELSIITTAAGVGSTFRVRFSEWQAGGARPLHRAGERAAGSRAALAGARVLLVDDDDDVRMPLARLLASHGATVLEAEGGGEAIELGVDAGIDVILMDIRMPSIDGMEATRRLRALGVRTPIVALTGDVLADRGESFRDAGCTTHLAKPIDVASLVTILVSLLSASSVSENASS